MIRSISVIALAAAFLAATGTPMAAANTAYRQSIAVYFPSGDAALTKQALAVIDETAKLAHEQPGSQIIVIGRNRSFRLGPGECAHCARTGDQDA